MQVGSDVKLVKIYQYTKSSTKIGAVKTLAIYV